MTQQEYADQFAAAIAIAWAVAQLEAQPLPEPDVAEASEDDIDTYFGDLH